MPADEFRIGIVGLESSHCDAFLDSLNLRRAHPGFRISALAGSPDHRGRSLATRFKLPLHPDYHQLIGSVDAVILAHRLGTQHDGPAMLFIEHQVPLFIDKPMAGSLDSAMSIHSAAAARNLPCASFSVIPLQKSFKRMLHECAEGQLPLPAFIEGPCDPSSPWGGIWFYGVHLVESMLSFHQATPHHVVYTRHDATIHQFRFTNADGGELWRLLGHAGSHQPIQMGFLGSGGQTVKPIQLDSDPYETGIAAIVRLFSEGVSEVPPRQTLAVHAVLEAMEAALATEGLPVSIRSVR